MQIIIQNWKNITLYQIYIKSKTPNHSVYMRWQLLFVKSDEVIHSSDDDEDDEQIVDFEGHKIKQCYFRHYYAVESLQMSFR